MSNDSLVEIYLPVNVLEKTKQWLLSREIDIASDIEDLGAMRGLFVYLINRTPKE